MSVVIGGIWHETNTFSPLLTDLDCFRQFQLIEGDAIREVFDGTNSELGGMLEAARELADQAQSESAALGAMELEARDFAFGSKVTYPASLM